MLSKREMQIAAALVMCGDVKEIASNMHLSELTVRTHLRNIQSKLGLHRLTEVVRWAICKFYRLDLSEFKRQLLAVIMLALLIPSIIEPATDFARRARRSRGRNEIEIVT